MNKKNLPITLSVLICSIFLTILLYFMGNQLIIREESFFQNNPYAAYIDMSLELKEIEKLKQKDIENIDEIAYFEEDRSSAKINDEILAIEKYDENFSKKRAESILEEGRMPENTGEISLDISLKEKLSLKIGDKINIDLGNRIIDGKVIKATSTNTKEEKFEKTENFEYEVVGFTKDYLNKNLGIYSAQTITDAESKELFVNINFNDIYKAFETQKEIESALKELEINGKLIIKDSYINYFGIGQSIFQRYMAMGIDILFVAIIIISFILMIKNIFNIWGLEKIKELSMYKSIGSTDFQILKLLGKEAVLMSFLPILLGHIIGFLILKNVYTSMGMEYEEFINQYQSIEFTPILSIIILIICFFVVIMATLKPTREISKIPIIDGLKGNLPLKKNKKKRDDNIWNELKINNRALFKSQRYIMIIGIYLLSLLILVLALSNLNDAFFNSDDSIYNIRINYFSNEYKIPEKLNEIREKADSKSSRIVASKHLFFPYEDGMFTDEFKEIGFNKKLNNFYYPEEKMLEGSIIFYDDKTFEEKFGNKGEVILVNRVQKNVKEKPDIKNSLKYLKNPKELEYKIFEDGKKYNIKIDREFENFENFDEFFRYYNLYLITSFDNYEKLMNSFNKEVIERGFDKLRGRYSLELSVQDNEIKSLAQELEKGIKADIAFDETFTIIDINTENNAREMEKKLFANIFILIATVILLLNLINSYTSTKLSFINRRKELGILLSAGFEKEELEKTLIREFFCQQIKSLLISIIFLVATALTIKYFSFYVDVKNLIKYYKFDALAVVVISVMATNISIYKVAMKNEFNKDLITMLK